VLRFAAHNRSESALHKTEETFRRLQTTYIFATDKIHRELTVSQGGKKVTVQAERAYCHFEVVANERQINIYVPKRRRDLEICLATHLPLALLKFLAVEETNIGRFPSIILARSLAVVDAILDTAGIISLPSIGRPKDDDDDYAAASEVGDIETPTLVLEVQQAGASTPLSTSRRSHLLVTPSHATHSQSKLADYFGRSASLGSGSRSNFASTPATSVFEGASPKEQTKRYAKLLTVVVDAARKLGAVPQFNLPRTASEILAPLGIDEVELAVRGSDRNAQIGAAGELFVSLIFNFESLRPTILSDFRMAQVIKSARVYERQLAVQNPWPSEKSHLLSTYGKLARQRNF
jgi:hypothetical protein